MFGFGGGGQGGSSTANISALLKLANSEFPFTGKIDKKRVSVRCAAGTAIPYAKHAISIDENRMDFARVRWAIPDGRPSRDEFNNLTFEQVWFARNHADIGGGYQENESRLSDTAVKWMVACAYTIPNGIKYDQSVLRLHNDSAGIQHDEVKSSYSTVPNFFGITWAYGARKLPKMENS